MFRNLLKPNSLLAAFLLLTLSGACCLICCEELFASTASSVEHCPMVKSEHCDFTKTEAPADQVAVSTDSVFECCGLKFNFVVGKLETSVYSDQTAAVAAIPKTVYGPPQLISKDRYESAAYHPPLFEDPDIHIKNCSFRI